MGRQPEKRSEDWAEQPRMGEIHRQAGSMAGTHGEADEATNVAYSRPARDQWKKK